MRGTVTLVAVTVLAAAAAAARLPRNLTVPQINPGCEHCVGPTVVVTAGVAANNTLHHLWGTKGALSFLVVAGTGGPDVTVDWEALHNNTPGSITFQKDPSHAFGFVIPSLVLYNDLKDNGAFQGQNESLRVPMADFQWSTRVLPGSPHQVAVEMETTHFQGMPLPNHTRILMKVSAYGQDGRSTVLPHLLRTPDSAQLDLILDNLNLNLTQETQEWNKKRWGMDVVMFSSENKAKEEDEDDFGIKFHTQKSLDDEHTPGVFNLDQITTARARAGNTAGGYLQWRPVSYLSSERDISLATTPNINTPQSYLNLTDSLKASLAYAVLGKNLTLPGAAVASVISFGQPKDGFYQSENYTTWTVAMGEGAAPLESFSTLIVVVISLGVVLPAAMLLVGCVVLAVRRYRRHADEE